MNVKVMVYLFFAILIVIYFRSALRSVRSHGFYVFFGFESLLALIFLNIEFWSSHNVSWLGILNHVLMAAAAFIALSSFYGLKKHGKPEEGWEETTVLITQGIFKYIRHPLYSSLMLASLGVLLKHFSLAAGFVFLFAVGSLFAASLVEEKENLEKFGNLYHRYKKGSKRFVPFLI